MNSMGHMKTIMVTGGAGYVGSILVRKLIAENYRVVCVDRLKFGGEVLLDIFNHDAFDFYPHDIGNQHAMTNLFQKYDFFAVIHLAAIVGDPACKREPDVALKTNWEASRFLLDQAMETGTPKFIFASTCSNYGKMGNRSGYVAEDSALAPVSLYAELKVKFEHLLIDPDVRKSDFCPTSLRFATVYGLSPRMRFDLTVNEFAKELAGGKELVVFGEQFWRPYCHVADFSNAMLTVLQAPAEATAYQVFNVGDTNENYTKKMIVEELLKQIPDGRIRYVTKEEDPRDYRVNFEKIKRTLGFKITRRVPDGIREIKLALESGIITNPDDQRFYNTPHTQSDHQ